MKCSRCGEECKAGQLFCYKCGTPIQVEADLNEIEDEGDVYESIEEIWPDYPSKEDFLFNEDEYQKTLDLKIITNR